MSEPEHPKGKDEKVVGDKTTEGCQADPCAHIEDPVQRALCKVCGLPVIGEAPFCKDHEPPVP
jgi:hypothetical protein